MNVRTGIPPSCAGAVRGLVMKPERKQSRPKKTRRQHQVEREAERWLAPPNPDVENPDWVVGAN